MKLFGIVIFTLTLFNASALAGIFKSDDTWNYQNCWRDGSHCLEVSAKFKTEKDCLRYVDFTSKISCLSSDKIKSTKANKPVCWRYTEGLSVGKCIKD